MLYALICKDKPDHLETRKANRDAHLAYGAEQGKTHFAGPLMDDAGGMMGSLIVIDVENRAEAESWLANDPYSQADLFASTEICAWKQVV